MFSFNGKSFKDEGYKAYVSPSVEEEEQAYNTIISHWEEFLALNDPNLEKDRDYFINKKNLYEVIRRCHKRALYHFIYHNLDEICEYKALAIECFWINTLKPFMVVNPKSVIYNCPNEMFSFFLIMNLIEELYKEKFSDQEFQYPSDKRIRDIIYKFKYCSLSREAMIAFVETFADTYKIGISYILDNKEESK